MYCKSCGHDEPEIKINNKLYCSNCGLSLGEEESLTPPIVKPIKNENNENELSNVFSTIGSTLEKNEGGSYRSKDFSVIEKPKITKHLSYDSQKPVQKMIEKELNLNTNLETEKTVQPEEEKSKVKGSDYEDTESKIKEELPRDIPAELDKEATILNDILSDIKPSDDEKNEKEENKTKPSQEIKDKKNLEESIKKVEELGAAQKLIDILKAGEEQKEIERKKKKLDGLGKAFSNLIDILNQPVESPKPARQETNITNDHIKEILDNLQKTKEIESPLARTEIERHNSDGITAKETEDNKTTKVSEKKAEEGEKTNNTLDLTDNEADPIETLKNNSEEAQTKEEIKDSLEIDEKINEEVIPSKNEINQNFIEAMHQELANKEEIKKDEALIYDEANLEEEGKELKKTQNEEELKKIDSEIHAFGDKKGHVDHWPEEEVQKTDQHQHMLTDFLKSLTHKEQIQAKSKKKKRSKNKKINFVKILFLLFSVIAAFSSFYTLSFFDQKEAEFNPSSIQFTASQPFYTPLGYKKDAITKISETSIIIKYNHILDKNKSFELIQEKLQNETRTDLKKYAEKNASTFLVTKKDNKDFYLLDDDKITWTEGDMWYILRRKGDLQKEELQLIAESIKNE